MIEFKNNITRDEVRANRDKIFVFGDNLLGIGYGGQAREMRGEYNTVGIPTKKSPTEFLTDSDYGRAAPLIAAKFGIIKGHLQCGRAVVIPSAGVGTGLADLPNKAPKIWAMVKENLERLGWKSAGD